MSKRRAVVSFPGSFGGHSRHFRRTCPAGSGWGSRAKEGSKEQAFLRKVLRRRLQRIVAGKRGFTDQLESHNFQQSVCEALPSCNGQLFFSSSLF